MEFSEATVRKEQRSGAVSRALRPNQGHHFWAERISEWFEHSSLQIEVSQIIIHKAHQPDVVVHFFDADGLSGKDLAEIDFFRAQTDATATGDHDGFVVEGIVDVWQSLVDARGRLIDFGRTFHAQGFVRTLDAPARRP